METADRLILGRELFLNQIGEMDNNYRRWEVLYLRETNSKDSELEEAVKTAGLYSIGDDSLEAFWAYYQEYINTDENYVIHENGPFWDSGGGNIDAGVYDKLWHFYSPLMDRLQVEYPILDFRLVIESSYEDTSELVITAEGHRGYETPFPFVAWRRWTKAWTSFFSMEAKDNPVVVYTELAGEYLNMKACVDKALNVFANKGEGSESAARWSIEVIPDDQNGWCAITEEGVAAYGDTPGVALRHLGELLEEE